MFFILDPAVVNTYTDETALFLGKDETVRFMNTGLFQGIGGTKQKKIKSLALIASENPAAAKDQEADVPDPTLFCTGYKKDRFYLFTRLEPD